MLVKIVEIIVSPDRPPADPEHVKELIKSMGVVGVFTAITINEKKRLISRTSQTGSGESGWTDGN